MTLDTPEQCEYLLNMLDRRRDNVESDIRDLENIFKNSPEYLKRCVNYSRRKQELDMNATLTVRVMMRKIDLQRKPKDVCEPSVQ